MTPEELRAHIADGTAERRIIFIGEAYYTRAPLMYDEWSMGVDPIDADKRTYAQWAIIWRMLSEGSVWRLEAFGDGIAGLAATGLLDLLIGHQDSGPDELRAALLAAGWVDRTPR